MHARQTDAYFSEIIGSGLRSPVVRHSGSRSHRVASAGPRPSPFATVENLLRDKRSFRHEWDNHSQAARKRSAFLPNPIATPHLLQETKSGHVKSVRLPKHDEQPDSHLPPLSDEDQDLEPRQPEPLPYSDRPKSVKFQDEELVLAISNLD